MKRTLTILITLTAFVGLLQGNSYAGAGDYGMPGEYLDYPFGARVAGMGGANTGLADDVTAIFNNPAGLATQDPIQIGLQHVMLFEDTMLDFLGFSLPVINIGHIGLGIVFLHSSDFYVVDDGYAPTSDHTSSMSKGSAYLSYARDIFPGLSAGVNVKVAYEDIFGHSGTGIGIDVGGLYSPIPEFQVGVYVKNALTPQVLGDMYFGSVTLGVAGKLFNNDLLLAVDVSKSLGPQDSILWEVGGELDVYNDMAFIRAGLDDELKVYLGVGGKYMNITLDYAASIEALGLAHKISAGYSMGGFEMSVRATPKIFSPVGIRKTTTFAIKAVSKYQIRDWELNIKDQNGDIVRSYSGEENPPNQIVWNGKDDRGLPAPDGNFSAQMIVTDSNGKVIKSNFESVKIQSAVPLDGEGGLELD
ncbi:UPF0164 family protein [bacterium]|nr:UPF0164 family protein [bacterium]